MKKQPPSLKTISELINILEKAKDNFGDIPVGAYAAEYCHEIRSKDDLMDVELRILEAYERQSQAASLPGTNPLTMEGKDKSAHFLVIFYLDEL